MIEVANKHGMQNDKKIQPQGMYFNLKYSHLIMKMYSLAYM